MKTLSKNTRIAETLKLIEGLAEHFGKVAVITVAGEKITASKLSALCSERVAKIEKANASRAAWQQAAAEERDFEEVIAPLIAGFKKTVHIMYDGQHKVLADFGLTPHKTPHPLDATETLAKVELAKATRAARHTMSKRQKAAIKGTLAPSAPTQAPAPPAAASPAPPAITIVMPPAAPAPQAAAPAPAVVQPSAGVPPTPPAVTPPPPGDASSGLNGASAH